MLHNIYFICIYICFVYTNIATGLEVGTRWATLSSLPQNTLNSVNFPKIAWLAAFHWNALETQKDWSLKYLHHSTVVCFMYWFILFLTSLTYFCLKPTFTLRTNPLQPGRLCPWWVSTVVLHPWLLVLSEEIRLIITHRPIIWYHHWGGGVELDKSLVDCALARKVEC